MEKLSTRPILPGTLQKEIRQVSKKRNKTAGSGNFIHKKWLKLGGGFYGLIGLLTYAVVEGREIVGFLRQFHGFAGFVETIDFGLIFGLLLNSLTNFITAITWPMFWSSEMQGGQIWLWILAAYAGYAAGTQLAQYQARARQNDL